MCAQNLCVLEKKKFFVYNKKNFASKSQACRVIHAPESPMLIYHGIMVMCLVGHFPDPTSNTIPKELKIYDKMKKSYYISLYYYAFSL